MDKDLDKLYDIYHANIKVDEYPQTENVNPIKVGDMLVALYGDKEIRGEVSQVFENYYLLKGKSGNSIKVTIDDITEHYPKNRMFESKSIRKFTESAVQTPPPDEKQGGDAKPAERVQQKKKKVIEDSEEEINKNTPDDQVDLTIEKIKTIGKLLYYKDVKYSEINSMFEKKLLSKEDYWYLLTEKENEIHIIRNNQKGFEIQPFANALVVHFLKNKSINESVKQIKVAGNSNFSVVSNIPPNLRKPMLNSLIRLLSGITKK